MICPKCGSDNVQIQLQTKRKGSFFSFLIRLILFLYLFILWLVSLLIPGHKTKTNKLAVCQNCGNNWRVTRGSVRRSAKQARVAAMAQTTKTKHGYSRDVQKINDSKFWENEWFGYAMVFFFAPLGVFLMYRYNQHLSRERKKMIAIIAMSVWLILFAMVAIFGDRKPNETTAAQQTDNTSQTEQKLESARETISISDQTKVKGDYIDALRKCTVMEAADIHTTGVGAKTDNAFNDGRDTCSATYTSAYTGNEAQFVSDVDSDWNTRKK